MANQTDPFAESVHGSNPQYLIEKITRLKIYNSSYWKEECFGLTSETIIDKAIALKYCGGLFGGNIRPSKFLCLILKLLQLQPDKDIVLEFIRNEDFKYLRLLGAFYLRLTGKAGEIYRCLEPLYNDYRKIAYRGLNGWSLKHVDEFVDMLLQEELVCDISLPHLPKRNKLEDIGVLKPRESVLDIELSDDDDMTEDDDSDHSSGESKEQKKTPDDIAVNDQMIDSIIESAIQNSQIIKDQSVASSTNAIPDTLPDMQLQELKNDVSRNYILSSDNPEVMKNEEDSEYRMREEQKREFPSDQTKPHDRSDRSQRGHGDNNRTVSDKNDRDERMRRDDSRDRRDRYYKRRDDSRVRDSRRNDSRDRGRYRYRSRSNDRRYRDDSRDRRIKRHDSREYDDRRRFRNDRSGRRRSRSDSRDRRKNYSDSDESSDVRRRRRSSSRSSSGSSSRSSLRTDSTRSRSRSRNRSVKLDNDAQKEENLSQALSSNVVEQEKIILPFNSEDQAKKKAAAAAAKRFDKIFRPSKASSNTSSATNPLKLTTNAPEGSVEYWNQMRTALGIKKLKE